MKQRFSSLDVRVIAHELSAALVSLRLANIYDLSSRIFLLKFAKPDHREQLLIDSGFRCHLTTFARSTAAAPSAFVARLRKFLRTRRVTKVEQVGTDRVLEIQFSEGQYRLFLEFYAGGNIVLTDADLTILGLLRNVSEGAEHEQYRLGLKYDLSLRQNYGGVPPLTKERIKDGLQRAIERQQADAQKPGKKVKKKSGDALRKALAVTTTEFPPVLLDHALQTTGYDRDTQPEEVIASEELLDRLLASLQEAQNVITDITSSDVAKGYILAKQGKTREQPADDEDEGATGGLLYDDFHPFKPSHLAADSSVTFLEHEGFNKTVDEFFSSLEGQKLESRLQEREEQAQRRLDAARQEQEKRISGLQSVQDLNVRKAQAIEANVERVEETVAAVNGLIAQGMDWVDIGRLIENEQKRHNAVAELVKLPLKLHENTVTLLLSEFDEPDEEDMADETESEASDSEDDTHAARKPAKAEDKRLNIDFDLALSPWANARQYYDQRRTAAVKQEKTAQASAKALKNTEQRVMADLKKGLKQEKDILRPVRKQMWFEKFVYFVSSDGYLVLAGRDAQQNEVLYRRYLRKGDVYVHADLHGAASVVIKNHPSTPEAPIPPTTLSQAGNLAVCTSSAWESKAVMSAWWVNSDQVSKTAPTGEYLTTGGFMVRGKKNFLPPAQLLLGFGVLFRISEESKARHIKHRVQDSNEQDTGSAGAARSQMAAEDNDDDEDEDDDFPDANRNADAGDDDDDDDFPDAAHQGTEDEDDALTDAKANGSVASGDEDEDYRRPEARNPLQNSDAPSQGKDMDDAAEETSSGDEDDDDDGEADDHEQNEQAAAPAEAAAVAATPAEELSAEERQSTGRQSSARERKEHRKAAAQAAQRRKGGPKVRGKTGKAKKIAQKYADQDDEDREIAMQLLGSRAAEQKREAEASAKMAKQESAEEARARRKAQHDKAQKQGLEAEEIRRLNLEEGVEALDEEEGAQLTQLDALVGMPLAGDEILEAIPICAPWAALGRYKYKAKMQPGQQKKGKALREVLGKWQKDASDGKKMDQQGQDSERIWPREAELIKGWKEAEIVGVIPVKSVRVMMGGGGAGGDKGKGGGGKGKGGGRGKGSKKAR
ncbi:hypothetical protein B0A50_02586 [Salinomyces thailandicus]|uniref:Ribosome quality control complex subunit 2 n=1 Tax=Salinomyces thailandicus TaxID=706561 RepID=A0A4V5N7K0_9PEZI|nr:hypothetical protein B0A50_02586 [Salinomyces thailandica]